MSPRRVAAALLCFAVLTTFGYAVLSPMFLESVTKGNFDRLAIGMTRAEVEEIFQEKPAQSWVNLCARNQVCFESVWEGRGTATIGFDEHERIVALHWNEKSIFQRIMATFRPASESTFTTVGPNQSD